VELVSIRAMGNCQGRSVAGEAPGRICRDVLAIIELAQAFRTGVCKRMGVHVHHHLVDLAPATHSQTSGQGHFSNETQGIGPELA
jgi:hypothetical protein